MKHARAIFLVLLVLSLVWSFGSAASATGNPLEADLDAKYNDPVSVATMIRDQFKETHQSLIEIMMNRLSGHIKPVLGDVPAALYPQRREFLLEVKGKLVAAIYSAKPEELDLKKTLFEGLYLATLIERALRMTPSHLDFIRTSVAALMQQWRETNTVLDFACQAGSNDEFIGITVYAKRSQSDIHIIFSQNSAPRFLLRYKPSYNGNLIFGCYEGIFSIIIAYIIYYVLPNPPLTPTEPTMSITEAEVLAVVGKSSGQAPSLIKSMHDRLSASLLFSLVPATYRHVASGIVVFFVVIGLLWLIARQLVWTGGEEIKIQVSNSERPVSTVTATSSQIAPNATSVPPQSNKRQGGGAGATMSLSSSMLVISALSFFAM